MIAKILLALVVIGLGGIAGYYVLKGSVPNFELPNSLQLNRDVPTPTTGAANVDVTISDEPNVQGNDKGGVVSEVSIAYTNGGFSPTLTTVRLGTRVTFTNESTKGMWVASDVHPTHQLLPGFDQLQSAGNSGVYQYTFTKIGTWRYHNHQNPTDIGTIVVVE